MATNYFTAPHPHPMKICKTRRGEYQHANKIHSLDDASHCDVTCELAQEVSMAAKQ